MLLNNDQRIAKKAYEKKLITLSIILTVFISFLNSEAGLKYPKLSSLFASIETLSQMELDEANITCSPYSLFYGKCKVLEPYFCADGAMAARCRFTGDQSHYCSAILVIICTIFPLEPHP